MCGHTTLMANNQQLIFDLVLETKQAVSDIKGMLAKTNSEAEKSGKSSGTAFGSSMKNAINTVIGTISFAMIANQVRNLFGLFTSFSNSNLQLAGAVKAANSAEVTRSTTLNDSTKSIEQKAMAIGIDTTQIYENTKASKSNEGAISSLEKQINKKERALEDETKALQKNVSAIESKRDLEISSLKSQKGFNTLSEEEQGLEKEITTLELQRFQAIKAGDANTVNSLNTILANKRLDQDITQKKLDLIDQETDKIEDLHKVQIQQLRVQMEASKNRFDIDIEPAKRKLEDLKASSVSLAGGSRIKQSVLDAIKQAKDAIPKVLKESDFTALREVLFKKYEGIIPRQSLTMAVADLIKAGLTDIDQVSSTIDRFVDIAAAGKAPLVSMGSAVEQLGEHFRSERGALGETAGLTEEYLSDLLPRGIALLQAEGKLRGKNIDNLTNEEAALAKRAGLLDATAGRQGIFNDKLKAGTLSADQVRAEFEKMALVLSLSLGPVLVDILRDFLPLAKQLTQFVSDNPELILQVAGLATAFIGIATAVSGLLTVWGIISPAITFMSVKFGLLSAFVASSGGVFATLKIVMLALTGPIGLVILAIAAITAGLVWASHNVEWFRNGVNEAFKKVVDDVMWAKDNWLQALGQIIGFFISLPFKVGIFMALMIQKIIDIITKTDWPKTFQSIGDGFGKVIDGLGKILGNFFSAENLKKFGNGFMDFIKGLLQGIASGIPGADLVINPIINKLPRFANGGSFMVGGEGGTDKNLVQFMATKREKVIIQTPAQQANDSSQTNSGNTVNQYYFGSGQTFSYPF